MPRRIVREQIKTKYDDLVNQYDEISLITNSIGTYFAMLALQECKIQKAYQHSMILETERLTLRRWTESDAESLFEYAQDPAVGPIAGWPPHKSIEESLSVIQNVFCGKECYAICLKGSNKPIGSIELLLQGHTNVPLALYFQNGISR